MVVNDDDTVQINRDGVTWHARCKDRDTTARLRLLHVRQSMPLSAMPNDSTEPPDHQMHTDEQERDVRATDAPATEPKENT